MGFCFLIHISDNLLCTNIQNLTLLNKLMTFITCYLSLNERVV